MNGFPSMEYASKPPQWAQTLLRLLQTPANQESVPGDLLEEYRETVQPTRGRWRADAWYVRQVNGFLWRASLPWGILRGGAELARLLFDTVAPPVNYGPRSAMTTWTALATYVVLGAHAAYRSGHARSGGLVALGASAIGYVIWVVGATVLFSLVIARDSGMLRLFNVTGGWGEVIFLPVMVLPVGVSAAVLGGMVGKAVRGFGRRADQPSN
jgi:hypothetical protein